MDEQSPQTFRVVASGVVVEVIAKPHPFGWVVRDAVTAARERVGLSPNPPVYLTPRAAVTAFVATDLDGVEEIRAPGEATTAEAMLAVASGYRLGMRSRVMEALVAARDACEGIVARTHMWDDAGAGGECVAAIDGLIARNVVDAGDDAGGDIVTKALAWGRDMERLANVPAEYDEHAGNPKREAAAMEARQSLYALRDAIFSAMKGTTKVTR